MTDLFAQPDEAATPLTPEETGGLIPSHIAFRFELNAAEQENMSRAQTWAMNRRHELLRACWEMCGDGRANFANAVRLRHRMVQIHTFPNGNGGHSRLMADLLIMQLGRDRFSWGTNRIARCESCSIPLH